MCRINTRGMQVAERPFAITEKGGAWRIGQSRPRILIEGYPPTLYTRANTIFREGEDMETVTEILQRHFGGIICNRMTTD